MLDQVYIVQTNLLWRIAYFILVSTLSNFSYCYKFDWTAFVSTYLFLSCKHWSFPENIFAVRAKKIPTVDKRLALKLNVCQHGK